MDDNATCQRTLAVQDCLDSEGIQRLVWPARSPDLNPIENVGDALGKQVAGRNYPPTNKNTLIRALTEEWDKLPQQLLDNVVQTCDAFLASSADRNGRPCKGRACSGNGLKSQGRNQGCGKTVVFIFTLSLLEACSYVPPQKTFQCFHRCGKFADVQSVRRLRHFPCLL
ncbi:transposable element Tc3 transposase [Trichonephila clavipes]|nr:transposable element Tc3 transposase [Trichonephila clavipes]